MACSRMPQEIDQTTWYYEYPSHLLIVHEVKDENGSHIKTDQFKLPWRMIDVSRARRPKRKLRRWR